MNNPYPNPEFRGYPKPNEILKPSQLVVEMVSFYLERLRILTLDPSSPYVQTGRSPSELIESLYQDQIPTLDLVTDCLTKIPKPKLINLIIALTDIIALHDDGSISGDSSLIDYFETAVNLDPDTGDDADAFDQESEYDLADTEVFLEPHSDEIVTPSQIIFNQIRVFFKDMIDLQEYTDPGSVLYNTPSELIPEHPSQFSLQSIETAKLLLGQLDSVQLVALIDSLSELLSDFDIESQRDWEYIVLYLNQATNHKPNLDTPQLLNY